MNQIKTTENWDQLKKLRNIDFDSGKFEVAGVTYYLETKLSFGRFIDFQILEYEMALGMTITEVHKTYGDLYKMLNQQRLADSIIHVNNLRNHASKLSEREPTIYKICCLFCNTEDEDRSVFNNDLVVKKMAAFKTSDIEAQDFFTLAVTLLPGYIAHYNAITLSISESLITAKEIVTAELNKNQG